MAEEFKVKLSELSPINKSVIEANAASQGISAQEYLASRGGVNPVTGKYGDSYNPIFDLTDAEYKAALAGKTGIAQGQSLNAAQEAKRQSVLGASGTAFKAPDGKFYENEREYRTTVAGGAGGASGSAGVDGPSLESQSGARSAYALLLSEFSRYGLESLVSPLQDLIKQGLSGPEFQIALRNTDAYQKRFAGNTERIKKGLVALSPGEYLALEDQYQNIMRNYGLPASYYTKDSIGTQAGFNKLIANDVSAVELEERVLTAQKRVLDAAPEVTTALRRFYPDIGNSDILAYTLDPEKGLEDIRKKVTAAEIGGAALGAGLSTSLTDAEYLRRYGVTKETAQRGYEAIGGGLERGRQLASIYQQAPYTQAIAEEEVFNLPGQSDATQKRKKIIGLEKAEFGGQTGMTSGALARDRAGSY
jgi:hypothetical protein